MKEKIDLLIRGGNVFDGTGGEPFRADIGIAEDKIVYVSKETEDRRQKTEVEAKKIIDIDGLAVAPGFIDTHAHSDFTLLADTRAEGKISQGITTEINGNCGLSAAPLQGEALKQREGDLEELDIQERWSTFQEYFEILERKGIAINFATLAGHGNIRASVSGYADKTPDNIELKRMQTLLWEAIHEGAIGLSTGLIYPPGIYSKTGELSSWGQAFNYAFVSLMSLKGEMGYTMAELQGLMERDISVLSRWSNNAETAECQKVLRQVKKNIIA